MEEHQWQYYTMTERHSRQKRNAIEQKEKIALIKHSSFLIGKKLLKM